MLPEELKQNVTVYGPLFPEPVQVILAQPMGGSVKLIGKGLRTSAVYDPILSAEQLGQLNSSPAQAPFDGDAGKFRLGVEANPFAASSGGWSHNLGFIDRLIANVTDSRLTGAQVEQASASSHPLPTDSAQALITDPPYYDAVPYAHLSDFFYVWLRRALPSHWAPLFAPESAPKGDEIVVDRPH
jgi:hypothetical protein